jgi:hypothetical protein
MLKGTFGSGRSEEGTSQVAFHETESKKIGLEVIWQKNWRDWK